MKHLFPSRGNGPNGRTVTARMRGHNPVDSAAFKKFFINQVTLHRAVRSTPVPENDAVGQLMRNLPSRLSTGECVRLRSAVTTIVSAVYEKCADPEKSLSSVRDMLSHLSKYRVNGTKEGVLSAIAEVAKLANKLPSDAVESALNLVSQEMNCATGKADLRDCMAEFRAIVQDFAGEPTAMRAAFGMRLTQLIVFRSKAVSLDMYDVFRGIPPQLPSKTPYYRLNRKPLIVGSGRSYHNRVLELCAQEC